MNQEIMYHNTPLGTVKIIGNEQGISSLRFAEGAVEEGESASNSLLLQCARELDEYFEGKRKNFEIKLDWYGSTDFNQAVWSALLQIPFGKKRTYMQIARKLNRPKAARAIGRANGLNPIAIIVPCHRLVGTDGKLRGYAYGLERKKALLDLEQSFSH